MSRPRHEQPTHGELEVLKFLWEHGPATGRDVFEALAAQRARAYTSVMSLLNVMVEKGMLERREQARAFVYAPLIEREATQGSMLGDLLQRAFEGSAMELVARLLASSQPSHEELDAIRQAIARYEESQGGSSQEPTS